MASSTSAGPKATGELHGRLKVLAASTLSDAFSTLGKQFEAAHPGSKVDFVFGASSDLASQLAQGAAADVFASDDPHATQQVEDSSTNGSTSTIFGANALEIAVAPANPKHVAALADLARPDVAVVLCVRAVLCGSLARQVLVNARVIVSPRSLESDANTALGNIEQGKADATIVDRADVTSTRGKVEAIPIPEDVNVVTTLSIVALANTQNSALAQAWIAFVVAHEHALDDTFGFLPPL